MSEMSIRSEGGATAVTDDPVADAKSCFRLCQDADGGNRERSIDDLLVLDGDPVARWGEGFAQRAIDGRPALISNTFPATLARIVNDVRQNRQSIHVHPAGGGADAAKAEILEGMIRHIEYDSNADAAYDTAVSSAAAGGAGFIRLVAEYISETSFEQKLLIKRVRNPFTVYIDPLAQEADSSDMRFCIISGLMGRAEFQRKYPKAEATTQLFDGRGDGVWLTSDEVRVAEFYRVENVPATLCLYGDGSTRWKDEKAPLPDGVELVKERQSAKRKVMWYLITGAEVLEKSEVPCYWIPVFPVWGTEIDIDGKISRSGIIRHAKDSAKMYDFFLTTATEEVAMRPRTPYIGAVGQFETAKGDWASANQVNYSFLEYDAVTVDGQLVGAPQRQPMADVPAGNLQMCAIARDNIKACTGIYDASLGARGNETSGVGIRARQRQGDIANFHYSDNLGRAIRHLGRCIVNMIPRVYDTQRVVRQLREDGSATTTEINAPGQEQDEFGRLVDMVLNDLTVGEYDTVISSGPAYNTMRQEAADGMGAMAQSWPLLMDLAGDKVIKSMDWPGKDEMSERVADGIKLKFPGLIKEEQGENEDPQVQTPKGPISLDEAGQLIGQMEQALEKMSAELGDLDKAADLARINADSREEVARINAAGRADVEELKGMITMLVSQMTPPPALVAAAMTDRPATVDSEVPAGPELGGLEPQNGMEMTDGTA